MAKNSSLSDVSNTHAPSNLDKTSASCEVLVVGAGPAGLGAAITLAASGVHVVVIDKAKFPREKCCGDGLTTGALRLLDLLGLDPTTVPNWRVCRDVLLQSPNGTEIDLSLPSDSAQQFAAVAPRYELDNALVVHARSLGITIVERCSFTSIQTKTPDNVIVTTDATNEYREISANYIIAADGMWSSVRKAFGVGQNGYLGEWHAFRQYVNSVTGPAKDRLMVWFEQDLLPGYAWSFPLPNGRANIGFGILRGSKYSVQEMNKLWPELLARPHIAKALGPTATLEARHTAWPIPARVNSIKLSSGRALFVGDAASSADIMTGEGIGQALLSGVIAGESIIKSHKYGPDYVGKTYEKKMKREFFADHQMSTLLNRILCSANLTNYVLKVVGLNQWTKRYFVRWMFEDEPRAILFTPKRWHSKFFKREGAFKSSSFKMPN